MGLPNEIWYKIITDCLSYKTFSTLTQVSKYFLSFESSDVIWKKFLKRDFDILCTSDENLKIKFITAYYYKKGKETLRLDASVYNFSVVTKALNSFNYKLEPWAQFYYGNILLNGWDGNQNVSEALKLMGPLAKDNYYPAIKALLDFLFNDGPGATEDQKSTISDLLTSKLNYLVVAQYAEAMIDLGMCYHRGVLYQPNPKKAIDLFKQAIGKGELTAATMLGVVYEERGELLLALTCYQSLINANIAIGFLYMGNYYEKEKSYTQAIENYEKAYNLGMHEVALKLGKIYYDGFNDENNIDHHLTKAKTWFECAKKAGFSDGIYMLGVINLELNNIPQAIDFFTQAYAMDHGKSALLLGKVFSQPMNLDVEKAFTHLKTAYLLGEKQADTFLYNLYFQHNQLMNDSILGQGVTWLVLGVLSNKELNMKLKSALKTDACINKWTTILYVSRIITTPDANVHLENDTDFRKICFQFPDLVSIIFNDSKQLLMCVKGKQRQEIAESMATIQEVFNANVSRRVPGM